MLCITRFALIHVLALTEPVEIVKKDLGHTNNMSIQEARDALFSLLHLVSRGNAFRSLVQAE